MRMVVAALACGLMAAPAVAADQFDLVCSAPKTEQMRYRIDLVKNEYCANDCALIQKIDEVSSGLLKLQWHEPVFRGDANYHTTIDRRTGEWRWYYSSPASFRVQDVVGMCRPAEFSGFPAARF